MTDPNDYKVLDARERATLAELDAKPVAYAAGRNMPEHFRALLAQGLAFRSHIGITITDKGREVLERVS